MMLEVFGLHLKVTVGKVYVNGRLVYDRKLDDRTMTQMEWDTFKQKYNYRDVRKILNNPNHPDYENAVMYMERAN